MSDLVEVVIDSIRVGLMSQQRVVILRELEKDRFLAIWIDPYMAEQITFALQEVEVARPMTHDLLKNILNKLNARVLRVEVTSLTSDVFYGNIILEVNGVEMNIDSRPSDALALAVRSNVPIFVSEDVMEKAGIVPEDNLETDAETADLDFDEPESLDEEDRLSVFDDFLDHLTQDDNSEDPEEDPEQD